MVRSPMKKKQESRSGRAKDGWNTIWNRTPGIASLRRWQPEEVRETCAHLRKKCLGGGNISAKTLMRKHLACERENQAARDVGPKRLRRGWTRQAGDESIWEVMQTGKPPNLSDFGFLIRENWEASGRIYQTTQDHSLSFKGGKA